MRSGRATVLVFVLAALAVSLGTGAAAARGEQASGTTVKVVLKEWKVVPSVSRCVPRGRITFVVRNTGTLDHELVVLRTSRAPGRLPVKGSGASEAGFQGETPDLRPGQTRRLTLRLRSGKYVLLCNLPGHYKAGQFSSFCAR